MVQTFLTRTGFMAAAADLDMARLGKQRVETKQIIAYLDGEGPKVANPHAYEMWNGWTESLILYGLCICHEWRVVRKFRDDVWGWLATKARSHGIAVPEGTDPRKWMDGNAIEHPPWKTDRWLIRSHRSNLIAKSEMVYGEMFPGTPLNMPYFWPKQEIPGGDEYDLWVSVADMGRLATGERKMPKGTSVIERPNGMGLVVIGA